MVSLFDFNPRINSKCCDFSNWTQEKFEKVFCEIDNALEACINKYPNFALVNIYFEGWITIKWPNYPQFDRAVKINLDWMEMVKTWRRCRLGPPPISNDQVRLPHDENNGCTSRPKPPNEQPSGACRKWANMVIPAQKQIEDTIYSAVIATCQQQAFQPGFPDPDISFASKCGRKHYDDKDDLPYVFKPIFEVVPPELPDDQVRPGNRDDDPPPVEDED